MMAAVKLEQVNDDHYTLAGELTFENVPAVSNQSRVLFDAMQGEVLINLANVSRADSAGLALLLDWLRNARARKVQLYFEELPEQLMRIARISELDKVLPLKSA